MSLICPVCGDAIDPDGPAVAQSRSAGNGSEWLPTYWVPFVFDLRTNPMRLVHAECYAQTEGIKPLISLVHQRDQLHLQERARLWEAERRSRPESV